MSDGITERKNNLFEDFYKTDNFDDSELQARLYEGIYYDFSIQTDSDIKGDSRTTDAPRMIQLDSMTTETNVKSDMLQHESEEQPLASKTTGDSQTMPSTDRTEFTQINTLAGREMNPSAHGCDNGSPEDLLVTQGKENEENSSKNYKSSKYMKNEHQESFEKDHNDTAYSKYNVVSKCVKKQRLSAKQTDKDEDNSDSEESICEVPIPPKPEPPLIDLQDSDEETNTSSGIDLILKKWKNIASTKTNSRSTSNHELEVIEILSSRQNTSFKSKNTDTINPDKSIQTSTCVQEVTEDIVLNCTAIQRGAKSVSEIKQLSKSTVANQGSKSIEDKNQNCKKKSPQNKLKRNNENNTNLQQEMSVISGKKSQIRMQQNIDKSNVYNVRHTDQDNTNYGLRDSGLESCNPAIDGKRQCNNEVDNHPKQKRQCTIQQNNEDVMPQDNNGGKKKNAMCNESISEEMRHYYNSSHGQENFDVGKLQQGMSKDPRMWAILDEDLMPCPSSRRRFWNVKCTNCHQEGHQRYDCLSPRRISCCHMCGMKGHMEFRCPQKMCMTCGKQQNTFRNTCEYCRVLYCTMCNSVGHEQEQCPDLWRRYHQTIDMNSAPQDLGNVMKPSRLLYCCNCAKRGHESSTCREYRWSENFPTPAVVTNYTDGPTYGSCAPSSSGSNPETDFLPSGATGSKTLIPPNSTNIQHARTEDVEPSANIDTLSSRINFYILPKEAEDISQMEENSSPAVINIWPIRTKLRQTKVNNVKFIDIIYSYGHFRNKNHQDARMILKNLSMYFCSRKPMLKSLINRKVAPVFLNTLLEKPIEFEVKIGFTNRRNLQLHLLGMKEYIEELYDLLRYWLNLRDDEKDYGIDVTTPPINPIKMFNFLNSRMPQLEKMRFTCYAEHIGGMNDPRWIYSCINNEKIKLVQHEKNTKIYNQSRKKLWRLQTRLLMIANTESEPNRLVRMFQLFMRKFESDRHLMGERLDTSTYLRLILLYNQLFVPHTSENVRNMLRRIEFEEKKKNDEKNSQQMQQEITVRDQGNVVYNVYSSSTASCVPQNINFENYSAINQQNNEILVEGQNMNNIALETSKTTDRSCDEITIYSSTQDSKIIMPLNIEPVSLKDYERNESQLSTSEVNIEPNLFENKRNINVNNMVHIPRLTKTHKKRLKKLNIKIENSIATAVGLIRKARAFKVPHMMNAADEMQRRIRNQTIRPKHIKTLSKLVLIEEKYQKEVNVYCKNL
ncbi:uncharacterized protein LOC112459343 isoform X2 [Temnothorax curvispinosus]|uniref:Zinc finger CCHC domain-containing protein 7 n=1 Tax=Temnothorax curvispinosus TaxID=300111 RepID=A0A6J1PVH1_9HYME|nr:uncharacterized protein LOC112455903 isoform X2 [Temnothorax curvispinosus]XP_024879155.1 uncharacterized protein LOC112459343 isoform X2 [Temnothorax curvispinosus]